MSLCTSTNYKFVFINFLTTKIAFSRAQKFREIHKDAALTLIACYKIVRLRHIGDSFTSICGKSFKKQKELVKH